MSRPSDPFASGFEPYRDPRTPSELKARFLYMFSGENIGFSFARGWMPIIVRACIEIDATLGDDKRGFHWVQIKEKFGAGRFYCRLDPAPENEAVRNAVHGIAHQAEVATQTACLVCDGAAIVQSYGGYDANLCAAHQPKGKQSGVDVVTSFRVYLGDDDV